MAKGENGPVTFINVFFVEPHDQERLIDRLAQHTETFARSAPGFLGSKLHRSFDGSKVVMYSRWASESAYRASRDHPAAVARLKEILSFAMTEPGAYDVIATFAPAELRPEAA